MEINIFCDSGVLTGEEKKKLIYLNSCIPSLCGSFGSGLASRLAIHLQNVVGGSALDSLTGFFNAFYYPAWTTVLHLMEQSGFSEEQVDTALKGQAMAMFLHLLDDHLVDGEIRVDPMILALRSRSWQIYEHSLMESGVSRELFQDSIRRYILAVSDTKKDFGSLDAYLSHFLDEAATWFILPEHLSRNHPHGESIIHMYNEFVMFWRLLDDLKDSRDDLERGDRTAFTILLDEVSDYEQAEVILLRFTEERLKSARILAEKSGLSSVAEQLESFYVSLKRQADD